jgi:hypothetical protein
MTQLDRERDAFPVLLYGILTNADIKNGAAGACTLLPRVNSPAPGDYEAAPQSPIRPRVTGHHATKRRHREASAALTGKPIHPSGFGGSLSRTESHHAPRVTLMYARTCRIARIRECA